MAQSVGRSAEAIARRFHEVYEDLAPAYDYNTRAGTAVVWPRVPENNRRLMIATIEVLLTEGVIQGG